MEKKYLFTFFIFIILILSCSKALIILRDDKAELNNYRKQYKQGDWQRRAHAVIEISKIDIPESSVFLLKAVDDIHPSVTILALDGLSKRQPGIALERIKHLAEFESNKNIRWYALKALAEYRDAKSAPIFVIGIKNSDWLIREESIKGLLMIDDYAIKYVSMPHIIQALYDKKINVRITTMRYLDIKDKRLYSILNKILYKNLKRNNTMLVAVLKALKGYKLDKKTRKTMINLLTHPNRDVRLLSFHVLREERRMDTKSAKKNT